MTYRKSEVSNKADQDALEADADIRFMIMAARNIDISEKETGSS